MMRIALDNVTFGYGRKENVLNGLSAEVTSFPLAVLGPNGAGKSTLLGLLAGRNAPRDGRIFLPSGGKSESVTPRMLRNRVSWMPQDIPALRGFSVREQIAYSGWLKGMPYRDSWIDSIRAAEAVNLQDHAKKPVRKLSGGQRRRLGIASAIISSPEILILDEPYAGLDPDQRGAVRKVLQQMSHETALIVSTHQTEDLDEVYGSVLVLEHGTVVFCGSISEFLAGVPADIPQHDRAEFAYRRAIRSALVGS